jgi:hypothetical protein
MRHKTGFFIGYATPAGRSGLMPVGEECYSYMAMKSASAVAAILDSALTKTEGGWEVEISIRAQTLIAISTLSLPPDTHLGL